MVISVASTVISIIAAILVSGYFYIKAQARPEIAFNVEQVQVFDKNRVGPIPLSVRDEAGRVIDDNVFAART
jgi:hypothetical protein